ncbi:MAG TPA: universal stress protein [Actinocrinis sp.]|nr:universal stress protein [Actinocrinis sp.]
MSTFATPQRIVVGIDGSPASAHAAEWAAHTAKRRGAELHLLHALNLTGTASLLSRLPFEEYRQNQTKQAESLLDELRTDLLHAHPRLSISTEISPDDATETLVAATRQAALTVVGTRGRGGFPGLAIGSVGLRLAAHCHGPIVLVPGRDAAGHAAPGPSRLEIVLGVAPREPAVVVEFAFDLAREWDATVHAVHVWEPIAPYNGYYYIEPSVLATTAKELLGAALEPTRRAHESVTCIAGTVCGTPAAALIEKARGARLLVLGAHRHRTPLSIGVGSVLHAVLTHAPCPVAVVPLVPRGA